MENNGNRTLLIHTTARLLRERGYGGLAISEILSATALPKGSLYYHFPGGKQQLAIEAAEWAGGLILDLIGQSFATAESFADGAARLVRAVAKLVASGDRIGGCPVMALLQAEGDAIDLASAGRRIHDAWVAATLAHARRLGHQAPEDVTALLLLQLQGAWALAQIRQDPEPFQFLSRQYGQGPR